MRSPGQPYLARILACLLLFTSLVPACQTARREPDTARRQGDLYAVLINGGGRPRINFQSHLTHIKGVIRVLERHGVARQNIAVFSADGSDPGEDLAVREINEDEDEFWILPRRAQQVLRPQIEYVDSRLDGYELQPARRESIEAWFVENGPLLQPNDTLFFYVTDHGEVNKDNLEDNTIVLWKEMLSVSELSEILSHVPAGVRTVMLMSQCFSGSFARLAASAANTCGYFASSADRPAYGCYPENRGVDGVGHSHHFLRGIDQLGNLAEAQEHVLVFDDTPDVPHSSSDVFLRRMLTMAAGEQDFRKIVDHYLERAWQDRGRWEPEIRLLDRIGHAYGIFSPRSLSELEQQIDSLPKVSKQLSQYAERWQEALDSVRQQNLQDFLAANPQWSELLANDSLKNLDDGARASLAADLIAELVPFAADAKRTQRIHLLRQRAENAAAAAYRMEVRLGVVLRMYNQLTNIAGRVFLHESAAVDRQAEYETLRRCENLAFAPLEAGNRNGLLALWPFAEDEPDDPVPFPRLADDQELVADVMPAWMGIRYRPPSKGEIDGDDRSPGAVTVMTVYPGSAADKAGLKVGDVVLGPPLAAFREPNQIREWTMQREIGEPAELLIEREGATQQITLLPDPFPIEMPKLPGPPKVGDAAPAIELTSYRGSVELSDDRDTLLFFWATWCAPCKFALPEVLRKASENDLYVVAITDEKAEVLDAFFADFSEPFPANIAIDKYRQSFQAYGVSGTPTFVLIDRDNVVRYYSTGFDARLGLAIP